MTIKFLSGKLCSAPPTKFFPYADVPECNMFPVLSSRPNRRYLQYAMFSFSREFFITCIIFFVFRDVPECSMFLVLSTALVKFVFFFCYYVGCLCNPRYKMGAVCSSLHPQMRIFQLLTRFRCIKFSFLLEGIFLRGMP